MSPVADAIATPRLVLVPLTPSMLGAVMRGNLTSVERQLDAPVDERVVDLPEQAHPPVLQTRDEEDPPQRPGAIQRLREHPIAQRGERRVADRLVGLRQRLHVRGQVERGVLDPAGLGLPSGAGALAGRRGAAGRPGGCAAGRSEPVPGGAPTLPADGRPLSRSARDERVRPGADRTAHRAPSQSTGRRSRRTARGDSAHRPSPCGSGRSR
jgi:hypothetical protein